MNKDKRKRIKVGLDPAPFGLTLLYVFPTLVLILSAEVWDTFRAKLKRGF